MFVSYSFVASGIVREGAVTANLVGNIVSSVLLLVGLGLSGYAIYKQR